MKTKLLKKLRKKLDFCKQKGHDVRYPYIAVHKVKHDFIWEYNFHPFIILACKMAGLEKINVSSMLYERTERRTKHQKIYQNKLRYLEYKEIIEKEKSNKT